MESHHARKREVSSAFTCVLEWTFDITYMRHRRRKTNMTKIECRRVLPFTWCVCEVHETNSWRSRPTLFSFVHSRKRCSYVKKRSASGYGLSLSFSLSLHSILVSLLLSITAQSLSLFFFPVVSSLTTSEHFYIYYYCIVLGSHTKKKI